MFSIYTYSYISMAVDSYLFKVCLELYLKLECAWSNERGTEKVLNFSFQQLQFSRRLCETTSFIAQYSTKVTSGSPPQCIDFRKNPRYQKFHKRQVQTIKICQFQVICVFIFFMVRLMSGIDIYCHIALPSHIFVYLPIYLLSLCCFGACFRLNTPM